MNKIFKFLNRVAHTVTGKHICEFPYPGRFRYERIQADDISTATVPMIVRTCPICGKELKTKLA